MHVIARARALPIGSRLLLALACGLIVLAGQSILAVRTVEANRTAALSVAHARGVITVTDEALNSILDLQTALRAYIITGDSRFLDQRALDRQAFDRHYQELLSLSADNPMQIARWQRVRDGLDAWEQGPVATSLAMRGSGPAGAMPTEYAPLIYAGQAQIDAIRSTIAESINVEQGIEDDRQRAAATANSVLLAVLPIGMLLTGFVGLGLILLMARDMRGELQRVANAARAIAGGDLDCRVGPVRTYEIAETAMAVDRIGAALKRDMERLRAIIGAQGDIARSEFQFDLLLDLVVERARTLTEADGAVIEMAEANDMVYRAASGAAQAHLGLRLPIDSSFSGLCVRSGLTLSCEDAADDPRVNADACRLVGIRSMAVAPLLHDGRGVGALKVHASRPGVFSARDLDTLQLLAGLLGAAIDHAHASRAKERSEATFRAVTESAYEAIISCASGGQLVFWNPAVVRLFGYSPAELADMHFEQILPESDELRDMARTGAPTLHTIGRRKDGTQFTLELSVAAWQAEGEHFWTGIMHDITERQMIERMKNELISVVSHELRTPLTSIRGSLGLLAGGLLETSPDKSKRMLDIAVQNTDRLMRLINDFLDLERLESGKVELRPVPCQAADLIRKSADEMLAMAHTASVGLRTAVIDDVTFSADADRIIQVLTNLLSNAIKFSAAGNAVWVSARAENDGVMFTVQDTGRGIPGDKLEAIFDRFQQVDPSDARRSSGTGLGLAICRSIVEQHGGRIWVNSSEGVGSTFNVWLPTVFVASAAHQPMAA